MGIRGELFTTQVVLDNRTYFFNVKENRTGDVFLQVVESKSKNGEDFDRHAIVIFAEDMQNFFKGMDESLSFIEKDRKEKQKKRLEKKEAAAKNGFGEKKRVYRSRKDDDEQPAEPKKSTNNVKRTGRVHVVSKRKDAE
jgi:hypothetical protein